MLKFYCGLGEFWGKCRRNSGEIKQGKNKVLGNKLFLETGFGGKKKLLLETSFWGKKLFFQKQAFGEQTSPKKAS